MIRTLRFRFALWISLFLFLLLMAFSVYVYRSLEDSLANAQDNALRQNAVQMAQFVEAQNGAPLLRADPERRGDPNLTIRVLDSNGEIIYATGSYRSMDQTAPDRASGGRGVYATLTDPFDPEDDVRLYTLPLSDNGTIFGYVESIQTMDGVEDPLESLQMLLVIAIPALVLIVGVGGYWLAGRALAPIDRITETARRITAQDLSTRLNLTRSDDEVGRLAATFDMMLSRLEGAFQREKEFTSDASHELRTPLAAIQTILETTRARPRSPDEYEEALDDIHAESDQLRNLIENLLTLAREESSRPRYDQRADLSQVLTDVSQTARPLAEAKGLHLTSTIPDGLHVVGDANLLARLFFNLLDNAIKFTEAGTIQMTAAASNGNIAVSVEDSGPGIPAEHLPRVFDRFYRVEAARSTAGTGLGLTIARRIAVNHGGGVVVQSAENEGTRVTVSLPIDQL